MRRAFVQRHHDLHESYRLHLEYLNGLRMDCDTSELMERALWRAGAIAAELREYSP